MAKMFGTHVCNTTIKHPPNPKGLIQEDMLKVQLNLTYYKGVGPHMYGSEPPSDTGFRLQATNKLNLFMLKTN